MPAISVIMPAFNAQPYIGEAISSILGQDFDDFELAPATWRPEKFKIEL